MPGRRRNKISIFIAGHHRPTIAREARMLLAVYVLLALVSILLQNPAATWYWVVPALLGQPVLRLFLLAEHTGCPQAPEMLTNSRTTRSIPPLRWLAWNMPYHAEHHAWPALPFHALPWAHELVKNEIAVQASGYLAVHTGLLGRLLSSRPTGETSSLEL